MPAIELPAADNSTAVRRSSLKKIVSADQASKSDVKFIKRMICKKKRMCGISAHPGTGLFESGWLCFFILQKRSEPFHL